MAEFEIRGVVLLSVSVIGVYDDKRDYAISRFKRDFRAPDILALIKERGATVHDVQVKTVMRIPASVDPSRPKRKPYGPRRLRVRPPPSDV